MRHGLMSPVPSFEVFKKPWTRHSGLHKGIQDAIAAGPAVSQRMVARDAKHLHRLQASAHTYANRKGYRVATTMDVKQLTLYFRVIGRIPRQTGKITEQAQRVLDNAAMRNRQKARENR